MLFNSTVFLFWFLPIACVSYYALAHVYGASAAKVLLCIASLVFYGWWNPRFVLLLIGSIAFNYTLSLALTGGEARQRRERWLFWLGITANLLLLVYYKYLFHVLDYLHVLGWVQRDYGSVLLPIGISFFTFTQIGYLVDCRQSLVRERNLLDYVLFVTFFPHLIAGPILHHREIMPQFANEATYRFRFDNLAVGMTLFSVGLIKKVLLADTIAPWAEAGFVAPHGIPFLNAWSTVLAYSMQLYFDFSGYSDMAIGLGILFGIKLPLNFNSPYKSTSVIDFWQRWHMTLTRYLTLLLYNPMALWIARLRQARGHAVNRQAAATPAGFATMIVVPTVFTMFLAGIWHGAGLQFIIYGLLHASYLTVNHAWRTVRPTRPATQTSPLATAWSILWRVVLTYDAVLVAQIYFRANSAGDATSMLAGMMGLHGSGLPLPVPLGTLQTLGMLGDHLRSLHLLEVGLRSSYNELTRPLFMNGLLTLGLGAIAFGAPNIYQILNQWSPALSKIKLQPTRRWLAWEPNAPSAVAVGTLLFVATLYFDRTGRFLYFQF